MNHDKNFQALLGSAEIRLTATVKPKSNKRNLGGECCRARTNLKALHKFYPSWLCTLQKLLFFLNTDVYFFCMHILQGCTRKAAGRLMRVII